MKTIMTILLALVFGCAWGQLPIDSVTKKVTYEHIIELDSSYTADKIFSMVKEWFSTDSKNFNRSNSEKQFNLTTALLGGPQKANPALVDQLYKNDQPLKLQDADERKLIGKVVLKYTGSKYGCLRLIYLEYDVKVQCKNSKLKIEVSNMNYTHYNPYDMKQVQLWTMRDEPPCGSKNTIETLMKCDKCEELMSFYVYLNHDVHDFEKSLYTYLKENKPVADDW